jgi:hypothetical protein
VGSLAAWDGADTAIAGEKRGIIKGVDDIVKGEASIGDAFDTVAGIGLTALGGGLTAKALAKKYAASKAAAAKKICKRSVWDDDEIFDQSLPEIRRAFLSKSYSASQPLIFFVSQFKAPLPQPSTNNAFKIKHTCKGSAP